MRSLPVLFVLPLVCFSMGFGCAGPPGGNATFQVSNPTKEQANEKKENAKEQDKQPELERKIIYSATIRLLVDDFILSSEQLQGVIDQYKGIIQKSENTGSKGQPRTGYWKVRIAPDQLHAFRKDVMSLGEVEITTLDSQDVTEEFYDVVERMKNKQTELESYRKMFEQVKTVADMVPIKKEMDRVQEELDRAKGRNKLLQNLISLTTVEIWLRERGTYTPAQAPNFRSSISQTFFHSIEGLQTFGEGFVLFLVALVPWLPILLPIIYLTIRWCRILFARR